MNKFIKRITCVALAALTLANAAVSATAANYDSCYASFTYNGTLCDGSGVHTAGATQNYKYFSMSTSATARYGGAGVEVHHVLLKWHKVQTLTGSSFGLEQIEEDNDTSAVSTSENFPLSYNLTNYAYHQIDDGINLLLTDNTDTNI